MPAELLLLVPIFLLAALIPGLRRVPDGSVFTLHRRGHYLRILHPGLRLTVPLVDRVGHQVPLIGHHLDLPLGGTGHAELFFQILEPERTGAALDEVDALVAQTALDHVRAADATVQPRAEADRLKEDLNSCLGRLGLYITRCKVHEAVDSQN